MTTDELLAHGEYMVQQKLENMDQLSEEEEQAQIDRLLQLTREPSEEERKPIKVHTHRTVKRILILAAAILVLFSVFMVAAVASKRDFSILNGIVSFENGKIHVHFSDADDSASMTITELEADLKEHGFEEVKLPRYFYEGEWQVKDVAYEAEEDTFDAKFSIKGKTEAYSISIVFYLEPDFSKDIMFYGAESGKTIKNGDVSVYIFEHGEGRCELIYYMNNSSYNVKPISTTESIRRIAETVS